MYLFLGEGVNQADLKSVLCGSKKVDCALQVVGQHVTLYGAEPEADVNSRNAKSGVEEIPEKIRGSCPGG
jgi:hypothetical protein